MAVKSATDKKKGITFSDPYGGGMVQVRENKIGKGDYKIDFTTNLVKPNGSVESRTSQLQNFVYGNNLDAQVEMLTQQLMLISAQNHNMYQSLSPELKRKVASSQLFKDIPVSLIPIYQGKMGLNMMQHPEMYQKY
jgi:hypothetical protein